MTDLPAQPAIYQAGVCTGGVEDKRTQKRWFVCSQISLLVMIFETSRMGRSRTIFGLREVLLDS